MASTIVPVTLDHDPISADHDERAVVAQVVQLLADNVEGAVRLVGPDGGAIELPPAVRKVLDQALTALSEDQVVVVNGLPRDLTLEDAAGILNVSRDYLNELLDNGSVPSTIVRDERRIPFVDLMAFKLKWRAERRAALTRLTQLNQELGLYERELRDAPPRDARLSSDPSARETDTGTENS